MLQVEIIPKSGQIKTISFERSRIKPINLRVNNTLHEHVHSVKFLGRTISSSLALKDHTDDVSCKAKKVAGTLRVVLSCTRGLPTRQSLRIYRSVIRPIIDYAANSTLLVPKYDSKPKSLAATQLKTCLGLIRTIPLHVAFALAGELPLQERKLLLTAKELIRLKAKCPKTFLMVQENSDAKNGLSKVYRNFQTLFGWLKVNVPPNAFPKLLIQTEYDFDPNSSKREIAMAYELHSSSLRRQGFALFAIYAVHPRLKTSCAVPFRT